MFNSIKESPNGDFKPKEKKTWKITMDYEITALAPEFEVVADSYAEVKKILESNSDYIKAITNPRFDVDFDCYVTDEVPNSSSPTIVVEYASWVMHF